MNTVRLKDIAEACGVSIATVSRSLSKTEVDSNSMAALIRRTAREMGYVPNAAAVTLKTSRSNNIGILYEDQMDHEYFSSLLDDLRSEAGKRGYDITLIGSRGGWGESNYLEHARRRNLDGVIVIQADFDSAEVIRLASSVMPTVVIDHAYDGCDCVSSDNRESMAQIVRYAWGRGHQRIALITGEQGAVTRERLSGFYKACAEMGIRVPEGSVVEGHFHEPEECAERIRALIEEPICATCILCPDDYSCLGAMWRLKEQGVRIPERVSLIGYDGIRMGQLLPPFLTTYRQDTKAIAGEALERLTDAIENPGEHRPGHVTVKGIMLEGGTVCEPYR